MPFTETEVPTLRKFQASDLLLDERNTFSLYN
jgi:hypothetical protein